MRLRLHTPTRTVIDRDAAKVVAESASGSFCLLPRHVDFVAPLVPGLLAWTDPRGREAFVAVDGGTLVKVGDRVLVSTPDAVEGGKLGQMRRLVAERFAVVDEREAEARLAADRLEAALVRRYIELERQ